MPDAARDILFLVKPDFRDGAGLESYCAGCAQVAGMLQIYSEVREKLEVRWLSAPPPHREVIKLIGQEHEDCPVLVLAAPAPAKLRGVKVGKFRGRQFMSGAMDVLNYLAQVHRDGRPG